MSGALMWTTWMSSNATLGFDRICSTRLTDWNSGAPGHLPVFDHSTSTG
jgi:hypothetical protein